MTTLRQAAQQALEAMDQLHRTGDTQVFDLCHKETTESLRAALAEPVQVVDEAAIHAAWSAGFVEGEKAALAEPGQEPYAWMAVGGTIWRRKTSEDDVPLYTAPPPQVLAPRMDAPQRKPLTEDEIRIAFRKAFPVGGVLFTGDAVSFARAVEAAHGIQEQA